MRVRFALVWLVCCAAGCGRSAKSAACVDADHDGFGRNCAAGSDCDDHDHDHHDDCGDAGSLDCEAEPLRSGCPCLAGQRRACYGGAPETEDVAACHAGRSVCAEGVWSECDGAVLPTFETCNQVDDDCDGSIDEGVQSPCGGCNPDCTGGVWGPPSSPFAADGQLDVSAAGELTLRLEQRAATTLWVPNTDEDTVSKVDVVQARELARYRIAGAPTRVAVDHRGDAWVLSGSKSSQATLTKIAGLGTRCIDRNGDGLLTAHDPVPLRLGDDECVLLSLPLGAAGDDARALAIDGAVAPDAERAGNVWVGLAGAERVLALDGERGAPLFTVDLPGFHAYASQFDVWGVLWLIDRDGRLASIDPALQPPLLRVREVPFSCYTLQGLGVEPRGTLLLAGLGCESVLGYDPRRDAWRRVQTRSLLSPTAVLGASDASWVLYASGRLGKLARDPLAIGADVPLASDTFMPYEAAALAADSFGQLWVVSTQGGPDGRGVATRFDPARNAVTAQVPVGLGPRGSGDLSGYALAGEFAREGHASHVFYGCERSPHDADGTSAGARTRWGALHMASLLGAGASVEVEVRQAANEAELNVALFRSLGALPGLTLPSLPALAEGGVVEVRLTLRSAAAIGAPRIARVGLEWSCPGPE